MRLAFGHTEICLDCFGMVLSGGGALGDNLSRLLPVPLYRKRFFLKKENIWVCEVGGNPQLALSSVDCIAGCYCPLVVTDQTYKQSLYFSSLE